VFVNFLKKTVGEGKNKKAGFIKSLRFIILLSSVIFQKNPDQFKTELQNPTSFLSRLLVSEVSAAGGLVKRQTAHDAYLEATDLMAWAFHSLGNHVQTLNLIELKNGDRLRDPDNNYLYLLLYPNIYATEIARAREKCAVESAYILAIMRQESLFQASVRSPVGAVGLMQLMPKTAALTLSRFPEFANSTAQSIDLTNPGVNILAGTCYLSDLLKRYKGNKAYAAAAYNAGENRVDRWVTTRDPLKSLPFFTEFIPFGETKNYVQKVMKNYENFVWIYEGRL